MASTSLEDLTPDTRQMAERLIVMAEDSGLVVRVASTLRSCTEQDALYAQGRTAPGNKVTKAPGCRSWHVYGRALDLFIVDDDGDDVPISDPRYDVLGEMGEKLGFVWGGVFDDPIHFEYHPGIRIEELCPEPGECEMAVARFGAHGNYYMPEDVAQDTAEQAADIRFGDVILSAFVGAVVFQTVAMAVRSMRNR